MSVTEAAAAFGSTLQGPTSYRLTWEWTSSAEGVATKEIDAANLAYVMGCILSDATTIPDGTTPPSPDYDVMIEDENGLDLFGGALADRSATEKQKEAPYPNGAVITGAITLSVSNAGDEKKGKVILNFNK